MTEVYCNISETIVDGKKADETKDQDSKAHCPKGRRFLMIRAIHPRA